MLRRSAIDGIGGFAAKTITEDIETSLLLHVRSDLVRIDALRNFPSRPAGLRASNVWLGVEKPVGFGWMSQDLNPTGAAGNAAAATADAHAIGDPRWMRPAMHGRRTWPTF